MAENRESLLEWDEFLSEGHKALNENDVVNAHRSRLLVISGTEIRVTDDEDKEILTAFTEEELKSQPKLERDKKKIQCLKKKPNTNKINFKLFDLGKYFENRTSIAGNHFSDLKQKFFSDIHNFQPTAIILPYLAVQPAHTSAGGQDIAEEINSKDKKGKLLKLDGMDGFFGADILKELRKSKPSLCKYEGLIFTNRNFLMFRTCNMWQTKGPLMTSNTNTTTSGTEFFLPVFFDHIRHCIGSKLIRVLMFTGSHARLIDGVSAFSSDLDKDGKKLSDHHLYEAALRVIGIEPQHAKDESIPPPIPQKRYIDAADDALLRNPVHRDIQFLGVDIRHFQRSRSGMLTYVCEDGTERKFQRNDGSGLISYVNDFDPDGIIIDWCFSENGDLATFLTNSGIVSKMWQKLNGKSLPGNKDPHELLIESLI